MPPKSTIMLKKSLQYDMAMVRKCMAGPNALYLTEELTDSMDLKPGMHVLDLGCGRALSSIFLAREFSVTVFAVDAQECAAETHEMLQDVQLDSQVFPINARAEALPFMPGTFDCLVCVNAYHNFGMEPGFFSQKLRPLLRDGAQVGLVLPATDAAFVAEKDLQEKERPAFWSMDNWRRWFEHELDIHVCEQLTCTQEAWQDWISASSLAENIDGLHAKLNPRLALVKIVGTVK